MVLSRTRTRATLEIGEISFHYSDLVPFSTEGLGLIAKKHR